MLAFDIQAAAPDMPLEVAQRAAAAFVCGSAGNRSTRLLIADMSLPSSQQRLWVLDLSDRNDPVLVMQTKVAHGAGSDPAKRGVPQRFSNVAESGMTSLGLYRIAERYSGEQGRPAYALDGLDGPFNSRARARRVVIHPASYVRPNGSVGRSLGCPAVDRPTFDRLAKWGLKDALLWVDGPDASLSTAPSLSCVATHASATQRVCRPPNTGQVAASSLPNAFRSEWAAAGASPWAS